MLIIFFNTITYCQFKTNEEVSLDAVGASIDFGFELDYNAEKELLQKGKITEAQYKLMFDNSFAKALPKGFITKAIDSVIKNYFFKYKAYKVAEWKYEGLDKTYDKQYTMLWIPPKQNASMPANLKPASPNGFFLTCISNINPIVAKVTQLPKTSPTNPATPITKTEPPIKKEVVNKPVSEKPVEAFIKKQPPTQIEPPPTKGLTKEVEVRLPNLQYSVFHKLDAVGIERAKAVFVASGKFTETAFDAIVKRANINGFAETINTARKIESVDESNAKAYYQGSFLLPFNGVAQIADLIWIPYAENITLAPNLLPSNGEDAFFFIADGNLAVENAYMNNIQKNIYLMPKEFVTNMKAKHKKDKPEVAEGHLVEYYYGEDMFKELMKLGYTEKEFDRMVKLTNKYYLPQGLEYNSYKNTPKALENYKAYKIAECYNGAGIIKLYWAPKEENKNLPYELQPLTDEGVFFFVNNGWGEENKSITSRIYANKPEWELYPVMYNYYASGGTDKQAEEAARKAESGTNEAQVNNNGSKPKKKNLNKYTADQVYKAEEKLINYLLSSDKELNPLLDKIMRSGKDAWILYKTRDRAFKILNTQISSCEEFLKEYGDYTRPKFKADVESRLAQATGVKYKI